MIPDEVINFIEKTMETCKVELTAGGIRLAKAWIQRVIFQGNTLSSFLFVIAMMPLNHKLRKCNNEYNVKKSQGKVNHLMHMDDIKLFEKNEKELETLIQAVEIYSQEKEWDLPCQ